MIKILLFTILILSNGLSFAQKKPNSEISVIDRNALIDINELEMFVSNKGELSYNLVDPLYTPGLLFPKGQRKKGIVFYSGIMLGAEDSNSNELLTSHAYYYSAFLPGERKANGEVADYTNEKYRVYKITKGDGIENPDFAEFPCELGAPCNSDGTPKMIGDQMLWCVYNDIHPEIQGGFTTTQTRMGIEIRQTVFAFEEEPLEKTIFLKFQIFNNGNRTLKNSQFSFHFEADIGKNSIDESYGCISKESLAYSYNLTNFDELYSVPPAIAYKVLQGPIVPSEGNKAISFGKEFDNFRNLQMTSFVTMDKGTEGHPQNVYNYQKGFYNFGGDYISPITGNPTKFWYESNPVTLTGDLRNKEDNSLAVLLSSGGFEMAPGDSQEVIFALVVGQCENNLLSLGEVFSNSKEIQRFFDNNYSFPEPPKQPEVNYEIGDRKITLDWSASKEEVENSFNAEKYSFEGYNIYQGETENGPWKLSKRFDIANGISNIKNSTFNEEICFEETRTWLSPDLGLEHSYDITEDVFKYEPLENWKEYYFAVSSYAVRTDEYSSVLESPKTVLKLAPQSQEITSEELGKITPVPNPYYGRSEYENGNEVVIRFVNLPDTKKTTIRIFNLSGDLVTTLEKESNTGNRFLDWNGKNKSDRKCASGVYIYHIQIEGLGKKTGKMICAFRR